MKSASTHLPPDQRMCQARAKETNGSRFDLIRLSRDIIRGWPVRGITSYPSIALGRISPLAPILLVDATFAEPTLTCFALAKLLLSQQLYPCAGK